EDRPLALSVKVVKVERELIAVGGIDHDDLRLRVLVEVDSGLVHELACHRHPFGVDVMDDGDDRCVRNSVRRTGRHPRWDDSLKAGHDRLERDRQLAHRRRPAFGPGLWSNPSWIETLIRTKLAPSNMRSDTSGGTPIRSHSALKAL